MYMSGVGNEQLGHVQEKALRESERAGKRKGEK